MVQYSFDDTEEAAERPATPPMSDRTRAAWLRLIRSENVGPVTFRQLVNLFGSAAAALEALPDLARRGGARARIRIASEAEVERELATAAAFGARFVALGEADYPARLAAVEGPPPLIAVKGGSGVLRRPIVAIVGARNASLAGRKMAEILGRGLGQAGFVVASGLARGIDASAHGASLDTGTIAVFAGGLDRLYPPDNEVLAARIVETGGALISEMPFGWEPRAEGTNDLIRNGATLVAKPEHVVEGLTDILGRLPEPRTVEEPMDDGLGHPLDVPESARKRVLEALGPTPMPIDDILRATGVRMGELQLILMELTLAGRLERHAGGRVSLVM